MRDFLLIYVNGQRYELRGARVFQSLSDFLRYDLRVTGTKVVCAEGDCGSCTVFVGTPGQQRIDYRTVTSCIQFLFQLDGTHIVTVEGLQHDAELNPVQEAMVRCQGSQCGFCTPGFVVSMCAMLESRKSVSENDVRAACVGNLCRCTGYEPIIRAGLEVDTRAMKPLNELYPPNEMLEDLRHHAAKELLIRDHGRTLFKPATIKSAVDFKSQISDCAIFSGGTDLGVQINKGIRDPKTVMSTSALSELREIRQEDGMLVVGATATLSEMESACADTIPEFARMLYWFGSPPIRNAGTLGGNIANGSPIGDTMPALYVLNGEIELMGTSGSHRVNINDFYTGYKRSISKPEELITRIFIPVPGPDEIFKLYKISKRKDLDISAFTAAFWMKLDAGRIDDIRIAYGGVGPNIIRLRRCEEFLRGNPFTHETMRQAGKLARTEINPISDVRGSAEYRAQLAENMMRKFWFDVAGTDGTDGNGRFDGDGAPSRLREQFASRT